MIEKIKNLLPKTKIRKATLYGGLALLLILIALIQVPSMLETKELRTLGYSTTEIKEIRSQRLTNRILKNEYYSSNLAQAISSKTLNKDYLELYVVTESCDEDDFLLYDRLMYKGYKHEDIVTLFKNLKFYEITPLLVFDFQPNLQPYIDDALANSDKNSTTHFELTNSYVDLYETTSEVDNLGKYDMLVNKTYYLPSTYEPAVLNELSIRYASDGITLDAGAAEGLEALCEGGRELGLVLYATSGYRPYETQESLYTRYVSANGEAEADRFSARPGHSEHQTGLAVDLAAGGESRNISSFSDTLEFNWVIENAASYGWILRYPEGKETITGYKYESWHYRYVGTELAQKIVASGLTYDEYYLLYIAPIPLVEN